MTSPSTHSNSPGVLTLKPSKEWLKKEHTLEGLDNRFTYSAKERRVVVAGGEPVEYDLSKLIVFKRMHSDCFEQALKVRLRLWMLVALAATRVLLRDEFATLNSCWKVGETEQKDDVVGLYSSVHLGFSYDRGVPPRINKERMTIGEGTPGLRILTLRDAHTKSCLDFLLSLDDLFKRADLDTREGSRIKATKLEEWTGSAVIFNNLGGRRHTRGWSVLSPHMSALMNMAHMTSDGKTIFQLFFDHRMCDGSIVTKFFDALYEELINHVLVEVSELIK